MQKPGSESSSYAGFLAAGWADLGGRPLLFCGVDSVDSGLLNKDKIQTSKSESKKNLSDMNSVLSELAFH